MNVLMNSVVLNPQEIQEIKEGGILWQKIRDELVAEVKVGATGVQINDKAIALFKQYEVEPAFYNYHDFPGYICVSVNECIIHGLGNETPFKSGDKVTLDIGFKYKSIFIDSAHTVLINPEENPEYANFIKKCYKILWSAIKTANNIKKERKPLLNGDIAAVVEGLVKSFNDKNCSIINNYVGHTIGKSLHQKPNVFNKGRKKGEGEELAVNTVVCIEPMLLKQNSGEYRQGPNGYDIIAKQPGTMTCHWEHMVLIKENGVEVLTATKEEIEEYM